MTETTWRSGRAGTEVAFITIVGGKHSWPQPGTETGFDSADAIWAFFSQFLTPVNGAPTIVSHPHDNVQRAGLRASFHVTAIGRPPIRYQWQKNGADLPGATDNWLTLSNLTPADDGARLCAVVNNDAGTATSKAATLNVLAAPAEPRITTPPADQSVQAGKSVHFASRATGSGPLIYQWQKGGFLGNMADIPGATDATHTTPPAALNEHHTLFRCVVSNAAGSTVSASEMLFVTEK